MAGGGWIDGLQLLFDTLPVDGIGQFYQWVIGIDDIAQLPVTLKEGDGLIGLGDHKCSKTAGFLFVMCAFM
jgi:hypothetical protein